MVNEGDLQFVACCEAMKRAARITKRDEHRCAPFVEYDWPPKLNGCDAELENDPIIYCPWCGKILVRKQDSAGR